MQDATDLEELRRARWFAGKARRIRAIREVGRFTVDNGAGLALADVAYEDGGQERYLLLDDGLRWGPLLRGLQRRPLDGPAGRLELRPSPALAALMPDAPDAAEHVPSTDQSNTLVAVGDRLLVKAYRKLEAGLHPEVELGAALAGSDAPVPAHGGSVHHVAPDGADTAIALLQELVIDAVSGWEPPIEAMATALRGEAAARDAVVAFWAAAGGAAGGLQTALADRLGLAHDPGAPARWRADAGAALAEAAGCDADAAAAREPLAARLDALIRGDGAPLTGRIHGDLHVAQLLHAPGRVLVIDFEGDPTAPLLRRRAPDTPLRDVAALLRSIDHVGAAAARRADGADPTAVVEASRAATLAAYRARASIAVDPGLLGALEAAAACRELVYAHRQLPEWLYAARAGLRRLLDRTP
ncbi:MAG TPA: hypothetical protein VFT50_02970 [Baekduia sp.]|nr:hypothetical protein [Baekduia sp.]